MTFLVTCAFIRTLWALLLAIYTLGIAAIPLTIMWIDHAREKRERKEMYCDATYHTVVK